MRFFLGPSVLGLRCLLLIRARTQQHNRKPSCIDFPLNFRALNRVAAGTLRVEAACHSHFGQIFLQAPGEGCSFFTSERHEDARRAPVGTKQ